MKRIAALELRESDRLSHSHYLKKLYREYGLWEIHTFPPVILLPGFDYEKEIRIGDGFFSFSGKPEAISDFYAIPAVEKTEEYTPYLFISKRITPDFDESISIRVKVRSLLLIEYDENSFRIIRQRPLKMDIDEKGSTQSTLA